MRLLTSLFFDQIYAKRDACAYCLAHLNIGHFRCKQRACVVLYTTSKCFDHGLDAYMYQGLHCHMARPCDDVTLISAEFLWTIDQHSVRGELFSCKFSGYHQVQKFFPVSISHPLFFFPFFLFFIDLLDLYDPRLNQVKELYLSRSACTLHSGHILVHIAVDM